VGDDGVTVVAAVKFPTKEDYRPIASRERSAGWTARGRNSRA